MVWDAVSVFEWYLWPSLKKHKEIFGKASRLLSVSTKFTRYDSQGSPNQPFWLQLPGQESVLLPGCLLLQGCGGVDGLEFVRLAKRVGTSYFKTCGWEVAKVAMAAFKFRRVGFNQIYEVPWELWKTSDPFCGYKYKLLGRWVLDPLTRDPGNSETPGDACGWRRVWTPKGWVFQDLWEA